MWFLELLVAEVLSLRLRFGSLEAAHSAWESLKAAETGLKCEISGPFGYLFHDQN